MNTDARLDQIRTSTLARIERAERNYMRAFIAAAILEALYLAAFVLLADFSNRTHVLVLLGTVGTYTLVGVGLLILGSHVTRSTLQVLKALELATRSAA
jgi:hypothetical protein